MEELQEISTTCSTLPANGTKPTYPNPCLNFAQIYWKEIFTILWPIFCLPVWLLNLGNGFEEIKFRCLFILLLMAGYWLTECIPLYITGLMPVFLMPVLQVMDSFKTSAAYFKDANMLFMAGLLLAICVENSNLHNRLSLLTVVKIGCSPRKIHLGLLIITMLLSMWLANSATTAMMCPIIKALLDELENEGIGSFYEPQSVEEKEAEEAPRPTKCTIAFYLGICFASSIGGLGTLVGTPTNLAYKGYADELGGGDNIEFVLWIGFNFPLIFIMTVFTWFWLQVFYLGMFRPKSEEGVWAKMAEEKQYAAYRVMKKKYEDLGPITWQETWVAILFVLCLILWFFRSPQFMKGWGDFLNESITWGDPQKTKSFVRDSSPAIFILFLMVAIPATTTCFQTCNRDPSKRPTKSGPGLINWQVLNDKMPWGMLFLLGGGFALGEASKVSGLTTWIGLQLDTFTNMDPFIVLMIVTAFASLLTEVTSNSAACLLLAPVVLKMAPKIGKHPFYLGNAVAMASSYSFMIPVGTPSNAIVAAYANIRTKDMAIGGSVVKLFTYFLTVFFGPIYGLLYWNLNSVPEPLLAAMDEEYLLKSLNATHAPLA